MRIVTVSLFMLITAMSYADDAFNGRWEGYAERDGVRTPLVFDLLSGPDGDYGRNGMPEFGWMSAPLAEVTREEGRIRMTFGEGGRSGTYEGALNGDEIIGDLVTEEMAATFYLKRSNKPLHFRRESVTFENDGITFGGELFVPRGEGPHPAIIHWHGSGDSTRWHYYYWAELFTRHGIAMLVWDKRGCGESGGEWREAGFEDYARDGIAGIEVLREHGDIDMSRVGAFGISQANWIMPIAVQLSDDIAYIVSVSGAQVSVEEEGYFDFMVKLKDLGFSEDDRSKALELIKLDNHVTRTGEGFEALMEYRKAHRREPWLRATAMPIAPPDAVDRAFYRRIIDHDPIPILNDLDIPILFLYGEDDKSVDAPRSVAILEAIKKAKSKDHTIHVFPDADHGVRVAASSDAAWSSRRHADGFIDGMIQWLSDRGYAGK